MRASNFSSVKGGNFLGENVSSTSFSEVVGAGFDVLMPMPTTTS